MVQIPAVQTVEEAFRLCRDLDASLNERLGCFAGAVAKLNPIFGDAVDRLVQRLKAADAGSAAPQVGEPMPPFLLPDDSGHLVGLEQLLERGPVALTFHRGHWCPFCRISINALTQAQSELEANGGHVVAIMPDRQAFTREAKQVAKAPFPILTDMDNGYALSLNLAIWVGAEMQEMMARQGQDLARAQGNDSWMLPIPATFVVARDGRIAARFVDPDYRKRMTIAEIGEAFRRARQFN
jgi:peroxiredoxin